MTKYNFYFESGKKAYIMHMSEQSDTKSIRILSENTNARDELLNLQKELTLISYDSTKKDIFVHLARIELKDNEISVFYEDGSSIEKYQETGNSQLLFIKDASNNISIWNATNNGDELWRYKISIHFRKFSGKIEIVSSPQSQIYDVVLDFGSEASQMLIQRKDSGIRREPIELFKGCAKHFYGISEDKIDSDIKKNVYEYDQQDEDVRLFRSIFFANRSKKQFATEDVSPIISKPSPDDSLLSFISRRDKKDIGQRVPNVKISYLADITPSNLNMGDLHRGIILRFIHEALCTIADKEANYSSREFSLRITLLVPNVMGQNDVSALARFIQESVENPAFLNQIPQSLHLAIIEIRTCSESDASLLNWINKQPSISPGRYLIIDIGKGTTDFSVVKVNSLEDAESIFRAGFIGAGNVLSYAIFDNYLAHMVSPLRRKRKELIENLLSAEPARLSQLEQAIENAKRRGEIKKSSSKNSCIRFTDASNLQVETLIERIESDVDVPDDFNIISDIIYKVVVKEIAGRIKNIKFDHIVLSGRAFKYKPLYDEIHKDFQTIFPSAKIHYDVSDAKKGCLYGPLTQIAVSKFSNMVGEPKSVNMSSPPQISIDIDECIESLKKSEIRNDFGKWTNIVKSIVDSASKLCRYAFSEDSDVNYENEGLADSLIQLTKDSTKKKKEKNDEEEIGRCHVVDIMSKGISIPYYGENTRIYISGSSYVPQNESPLNPDAKYSIYFDGEEFYLRSEDSCHPLRKDTTLISSSPLLFESLFPYSIQLLGKQVEIPIPKAIHE